MEQKVRAISRSTSLRSTEPVPVSALTGNDRGYEAWRPALIAFYERDCLTQKAENLRRGAPMDYLDKRAIDALKAAAELIPQRKAA